MVVNAIGQGPRRLSDILQVAVSAGDEVDDVSRSAVNVAVYPVCSFIVGTCEVHGPCDVIAGTTVYAITFVAAVHGLIGSLFSVWNLSGDRR